MRCYFITENCCLKPSLGLEIGFSQVYVKPLSNRLTPFWPQKASYHFPVHCLQIQSILNEKRWGILEKVHCNATTKGRRREMYRKGVCVCGGVVRVIQSTRNWSGIAGFEGEGGHESEYAGSLYKLTVTPRGKPVKKLGPQSNKYMELNSASN